MSDEEHLANVKGFTDGIQAQASAARSGSAPEPVPADTAELDLSEPDSGEPELLGIARQAPALAPTLRPAEKAQQVSEDEPAPTGPAPSSGAQQEVNDIFASLRG